MVVNRLAILTIPKNGNKMPSRNSFETCFKAISNKVIKILRKLERYFKLKGHLLLRSLTFNLCTKILNSWSQTLNILSIYGLWMVTESIKAEKLYELRNNLFLNTSENIWRKYSPQHHLLKNVINHVILFASATLNHCHRCVFGE